MSDSHIPPASGADASDTAAQRPGTQPSAPELAVELPYPEELQAMLGGAYVVEDFIGQGGMGAVYKGLQMPLKRPVAIKILAKGAGQDYDFEERFKREAYAMAALTHPHIVQVYDCGDAGEEFLFISMEFVQGGDLSDTIKAQQVTPELALKLLPQICDGLQAAHERGIVHRDIKPANIFLTADGRAKVADFGLAKKFNSGATMVTKTGLGLGTPDYAAPEQFDNAPDIDHRADIYSLGVMFYQLLTGRLPRGAWKAPSARVPIDSRIDDVVLKAMESERDSRYQTVAELKADILRITMEGQRTGAVPVAKYASAASPGVTGPVPTRSGPMPARPSGAMPPKNTGAMPAQNTGVVPIPRHTSAIPVRHTGPAPQPRATGGVPAGRTSGAVPQARKSGSVPVPAKPQQVPPGRVPQRTNSVPVKKSGPSPALFAGIAVVAVLGLGGWFFTKSAGGGKGAVVELLNLSDLKGRPLRGNWITTNTGLKCSTPFQPGLKDDDRMPVFEFAYTPPEEYDYEIEFTRGAGSVAHVLAAQGRNFVHEFTQGSDNGTPARAGLSSFEGKTINQSNEGWVMTPPPTRNGTRHVAVVEVRKGSVRSFLNGKAILDWSGDFSRLKSPNGFRLSGSEAHLGLGGWGADVTFHRATVREVSGAGQFSAPEALATAGGTGTSSIKPHELKALVDWLVLRKGYAVVQVSGVRRKITQVQEMPQAIEQLLEVEVSGSSPNAIPQAVLASLTRANEMVRIVLPNCGIKAPEANALIANKSQLKYLDLHRNSIDDSIIAPASQLPMLESLNLGYSKTITGAGFDSLEGHPKFAGLTVNDCAMTETGLRAIGKITSLKGLNIQSMKITSPQLAALAGLTKLETLYLKNTEVTIEGLAALRHAASLRRMELSLGRGVKSPAELASLGNVFPALKELVIDFSGPNEAGNAPMLAQLGDLAALKTLTRLDVRGSTSLKASTIAGLDRLPLLDYFLVSFPFKDEDVAVLKGCKTLRTLRLENADLTEIGALNLASVVSLREVNRGAFNDAGLKVFREHRSDVRISD